MVDRKRLLAAVAKLQAVVEKCEATNKPGPCPENKPEPSGSGRPAGAAKPVPSGRAPAISSYTAKPFKESPEAKAVLQKVAALKAGKAKVKDAALATVELMKRKRDQADAAIAKAEKMLSKLKDQKTAKQKIEGSKKLKARAVAAVSKRMAKITTLVQRMKDRGGGSAQPTPAEPKKAAGADTAVAKAIATELEGMVNDADGFHQAAAMAGSVK